MGVVRRHPILTVVSVVVLAVLLMASLWLLPRLWRFLVGFVERLSRWFSRATGSSPSESPKSGDV